MNRTKDGTTRSLLIKNKLISDRQEIRIYALVSYLPTSH